MFRQFGAVALAASMFVSTAAFAATQANQGALSAGVPASVKQAQSTDDGIAAVLLARCGCYYWWDCAYCVW